MRKLRALFIVLASAAVFTIAFGVVALVIVKRMRTGKWAVPDRSDISYVKSRIMPGKSAPRTIYLNGAPVTIIAGPEFSHENRSGLVANRGLKEAKLPGFSGSKRGWRSILTCVQKQFEPFDVVVTDERPSKAGYVMVVVSGRARDLGLDKKSHVGGLAPFNGGIVPNPIVFAFARELRNKSNTVCETIAMEVGHAYGLDHGYLCKDVMTYLRGCGKKRFVDKDVRCGEKKARDCEGGKPRQNSYRYLMRVLGPRNKTKELAGPAHDH